MIELKIHVPAPGTWQERHIAGGSGIVGSPVPLGEGLSGVCIDYEGAIHQQKMIRSVLSCLANRNIRAERQICPDWAPSLAVSPRAGRVSPPLPPQALVGQIEFVEWTPNGSLATLRVYEPAGS
jgi:hypothetical protein